MAQKADSARVSGKFRRNIFVRARNKFVNEDARDAKICKAQFAGEKNSPKNSGSSKSKKKNDWRKSENRTMRYFADCFS